MVTIKEVAKRAGVSLGTVSNVINNVSTVSEKKRKIVNAVINELGYMRNNAASQLRSNISNSIGLIIPDITNPFYPAIARGIQDSANKQGYNMFLCNNDRDIEVEKQALHALLGKKVDGIIMLKPRLDYKTINDIQKQCVLVLMDMQPGLADCDIINIDDYGGICCAVQKAYEFGHTKIAFIAGRNDSMSAQCRRQAFRDEIRGLNLPDSPEYFADGDYSFESGCKCFENFMCLENPPTVIITANDQMAKGVLFRAYETGVRIPEDISVIGYDDIADAQWSIPPLTTVRNPKYEMGQECANLLFKRIREKRNPEYVYNREVIMLKTEFVMRKSLSYLV